tara:strand:+ start:197 stop:505 length:309 start_codon:yes stop_codon:yes gene_type:complete
MKESNKLPQAISHKKLSFLLLKAPKDKFANSEESEKITKLQDEFLTELEDWEFSTKSLLKKISNRNEKYLQDKSPNALMALGAMEVHLNMALQALQGYKKDL